MLNVKKLNLSGWNCKHGDSSLEGYAIGLNLHFTPQTACHSFLPSFLSILLLLTTVFIDQVKYFRHMYKYLGKKDK